MNENHLDICSISSVILIGFIFFVVFHDGFVFCLALKPHKEW